MAPRAGLISRAQVPRTAPRPRGIRPAPALGSTWHPRPPPRPSPASPRPDSNISTAHARLKPQATPLTHPAHALHAPHAPRAPRAPTRLRARAGLPNGQWVTPSPIRRLFAVRPSARVSQSGPWADGVYPAGPHACVPSPARPFRNARHSTGPRPRPQLNPVPRPQRPPSGAMSQSGTPGLQEESLQGEPPGTGRPQWGGQRLRGGRAPGREQEPRLRL